MIPAALLAAAMCLLPGAGLAAAQAPAEEARAASPQNPPAPTPGTVRLTVAEAVRHGLEASHRLAGIRAQQAAAEAAVSGQEAERLPQIAAQAGYQRTAHVEPFGIPGPTGILRVIYPDIPDNFRTRLDLAWPIYTSGRVGAQIRAATAEFEATGKDDLAAQSDLKLEITRAFWALVTAREAEHVVAQALENIDAHLADVRNRQKAGLVPPNDVLSTEAQRSHQQVLLIQARNIVASAAVDLGRLAGLEPGTAIETDAQLEQPSPSQRAEAEALVGEARTVRADRQAIQLRITSFTAREDAAKANRWPIIGVAGGVDYARPNPKIFPREATWQTFWDVGVSLSWTLWDGGRVAASVAQAAANRSVLEERLKEFDTVLDADVRQRLLDLDSARAAVQAATDGIRSAAEARRVVEERFKAGVAINTEVLDAQQALLLSELERTRALADVRLAEARLERALGR
jgi:outer membrane protein TolC